MPRLSIIIPHRQNDRRLEATLLSVLENRPADSEVIVVHDGSYQDPYDLSDEVIFVHEDPGCGPIELLNAGIMATCAPAVCVLLDGTLVTDGWADSPVRTLQEPGVNTVAVAVHHTQAAKISFGINAASLQNVSKLQSGRVDVVRQSETCCGPSLACGFYRRQVLLALGGWNADLDETTADLEFAWTLNALGMQCAIDANSQAKVDEGTAARRLSSVALSRLASLSVAYGLEIPSLLNSFNSFLRDTLKGRPVSAFAWARGLRDANTIRRTQVRLAHAKQRLAAEHDSGGALRIFGSDSKLSTARRKAA